MHPTAEARFFFIEASVVVCRSELDGVMVGKERLQHHPARRLAAARASGNLRQQLKCSFGGAKIRESSTRRQSPPRPPASRWECHVPWRSSACPPAGRSRRLQRAEHALQVVAPAHGVAIEPRDARLRKQPVQHVLPASPSRCPDIAHTRCRTWDRSSARAA